MGNNDTTSDEIRRQKAELERRVQERTAQLETINKELEAFAYSVTHDLRAPLRSIRGFSEVLLERYSQALDDAGKGFLHRICESSAHMDRLIDALLKLSRLSRNELRFQNVDLSAIARKILEDLARAEPGRQVRAEVASGVTAWGDERLLAVVIDNLVRNAWKFTSKTENAHVEFGRRETDGALYVRDNGAGFDIKYADRLFGVFQRLHAPSEFPGTGVGLATVQRVINRHGGRVWAEAAVNQGATFYFTLPPES